MNESQFLTTVNLIASKYGMMIDINFDTHVISLAGNHDKEAEEMCAVEIDNLFIDL